jgi:GMP synthase-like glutamine amidotransferase
VKVLAFRHVPFEHLGLIAPALESRGVAVEYADLYADGASDPNPEEYAGLVFMGGPMSANDALPWLASEMRWIEQAARRGQPVLGVCLGAQLIAKALGARVYRNPVKEIGWFGIEFTPEAAGDRLFSAAAPREVVFHWHGETFDLSTRAVHLAFSDACRHQAFRVGQNIYGLQFHLEVTPAMIADWCKQDANCGDVRELSKPLDPERNAARLAVLSHSVFGNWCDLLVPSHWQDREA